MAQAIAPQRVLIVGAGPVGALAALYAANRGDHVEVYELRGGMFCPTPPLSLYCLFLLLRHLYDAYVKDISM